MPLDTHSYALRPGSSDARNLPPIDITPEIIACHIDHARRLRAEAFVRLFQQIGAALFRLVERHPRIEPGRPATSAR